MPPFLCAEMNCNDIDLKATKSIDEQAQIRGRTEKRHRFKFSAMNTHPIYVSASSLHSLL